jgi:hypothetical protein
MDKDCHIKFRFATFILFELVANHVNMFWGGTIYVCTIGGSSGISTKLKFHTKGMGGGGF